MNPESAHALFEGRRKRERDRHWLRSPRLPDREFRPEWRPWQVGSLLSVLFEAVPSGCRDQCQRRPESGSSSEPGRRFLLGPLKTINHVLGHGVLRLELLKDAVLLLQIGFD